MQPDIRLQVRIGIGVCVAVLALILVLALVPDPFFRRQTYTTQLDDVAGVAPGTEVYFRGAALGDVRSVALDPASQRFTVRFAVSRDWKPGPCAQVRVSTANPLTPARLTLDSADAAPAAACALARTQSGCDPIALRPGLAADTDARPIVACRRAPDLVQAAAAALAEAAGVAKTANALAQQLAVVMQGAEGGKGVAGGMVTDVAGTLDAVHALSTQIERNLRPGQGDLAVTLGNLRQFSGRAASVDVAAINAMLQETRALVTANQAHVTEMLRSGAGTASQARATLEASSASLVRASTNLERISSNLDALSERAAADPTALLRGQRYADPPPPQPSSRSGDKP